MTYQKSRIPNRVLRDEILFKLQGKEITMGEIARRLGWFRPPQPDTSRLRRTLGIAREGSHGRNIYRETINEQTFREICKAANLDPQDVEL